jgi:hypothetical protein
LSHLQKHCFNGFGLFCLYDFDSREPFSRFVAEDLRQLLLKVITMPRFISSTSALLGLFSACCCGTSAEFIYDKIIAQLLDHAAKE